MTGLTHVNPDADFGDAPTILRVFSTPDKNRLMALTDWDRSFLKALYVTEASYSGQRLQIVHHMVGDLAP